MRRKINGLLILLAIVSAGEAYLFSEESAAFSSKMINVDFAASLNCGIFSKAPAGPFENEEPVVASLASGRFGFDATVSYTINDTLSVGPNIGIHIMKSIYEMKEHIYIDVPLRVGLKVGRGNTFVQPFLGYFLCATSFLPSGFEVGTRLALAGFFADASVIIGSEIWGHATIGVTLTNLFQMKM